MTRPTWSTKGRFIGLRVRNVGGTRERIARSGPISTFDTHIILYKFHLFCTLGRDFSIKVQNEMIRYGFMMLHPHECVR